MTEAIDSVMFILALTLGLFILGGCSQYQATADQSDIYTTPADSQECPTGGTIVVVNEYPYIVCNGEQGIIGATGPQGSTGAVGPVGSPGKNATPVTTVRFCPNVIASYPSTFPEYGLCLGNQLYGVYSTNGGFLALLLPGKYSSEGVNDSCTFTIESECKVSQ